MYGWNTLLLDVGYASSQSTSPKPHRGTDDNSQTIEEPDEVTNLTSGSEAERRGRLRRLGYPIPGVTTFCYLTYLMGRFTIASHFAAFIH